MAAAPAAARAAGTGGGDAAAPVVKAEAASYTIEQGGQVDAVLGSVMPGNPAYSFVVVSGPTSGELLHVDAASGRFIYTSMVIGDDSFDFAIQKGGQTVDSATMA